MHDATVGERVTRMYARVVVSLRWLLPLAWVAAAVAAWAFLPGLGGSGAAPLGDIVPSDARAVQVQARTLQLFGSTPSTDTLVVQRNPRGLSRAQLDAQVAAAQGRGQRRRPPGLRAAVPIVNVPLPGVRWPERVTTGVTYLFMGPDLNLEERRDVARDYVARLRPSPGTTVGITGAGPARLEQFDAIDRVLPRIEIATVLLILAIVALYFRSVGAPLVTLATVAVAYVSAIGALGWAGERAGVTAPSEIEPVLVVLLLGLVTDYTIFFMSETRSRLLRGEPRLSAVRAATARIAPIVATAGVLVAGGAISLLAGRLQFFRVFGPGLALSALVVTVICVTFVPAVLAVAGPWLFGRRVRHAVAPDDATAAVVAGVPGDGGDGLRDRARLRFAGPLGALRASRRQSEDEGGHVVTALTARMLATRPVSALLVVATVAALVIAALGVRSSDLSVSFVPSLPSDAAARRAADAATAGFGPGILAPTDLVLERQGIGTDKAALGRFQDLLARQPGVAAVLGAGRPPGTALERGVVSRDGGAVRFVVLLDHEPTGAAAVDDLKQLQADVPALARRAGLPAGVRASYAGETALAAETVDALVGDLKRIAAATAVVIFLLLALFLRALVAPVLLLAAGALAFAGSLGLTALLLPWVLGGEGFIYYVPLVAGVLLIGLGSDYNVFLTGRIRAEARRRRMREAVAVAAPAASRAITVAGITLAATFALLALVPLRPFRELAMLMAIGVLVDALLVRPVLIPAVIALIGRKVWWPGRPERPPARAAFLDAVADATGLPEREAEDITHATLATLGERLPRREVRQVGRHLPEGLAAALRSGSRGGGPFGSDEFVARVAERVQAPAADIRDDVRAVFATLRKSLPETEVDYIRAALSEDYRPLLGDAVDAAPPEPPAAVAGTGRGRGPASDGTPPA